MKAAIFDYDLPPEQIAQNPASPRDHCRMFVLHRQNGKMEDTFFYRLPVFLNPGDAIVLNDTKVVPSVMRGYDENGRQIELKLVSRKTETLFDCLLESKKGLEISSTLSFGQSELSGKVLGINSFGTGWLIDFTAKNGDVDETIDRLGKIFYPLYLPQNGDLSDYQTVYARKPRSLQPPVAGMHFTQTLLEQIKQMGVHVAFITQHVGRLDQLETILGDGDIENHKMYPEYYEVSEETAKIINDAKDKGRRIFAVGTTVTRTLESVAVETGYITPGKGWSDLFIYPGYKWRVVDAIVSNFQTPKSTGLMLACAFAGIEEVMTLYREAVKRGYRLFEFGDCALYI